MQNNNIVFGIVGKIASGKTAVAKIMESDYGFRHIDVDKCGHEALHKVRDSLVREFGSSVANTDGSINRQTLGNIVFADVKKLFLLNSIVHPQIKRDILEMLNGFTEQRIVLDAALLFEIGLDEICDFIITVDAPDENIIQRAVVMRKWEKERIQNILHSQEYLQFLKEKTNYIIFNNGTLQKLHKQIEILINIVF